MAFSWRGHWAVVTAFALWAGCNAEASAGSREQNAALRDAFGPLYEGFERTVSELYVSQFARSNNGRLYSNELKTFLETHSLGIEVKTTKDRYWSLRDIGIRLKNGDLVVPRTHPPSETSKERLLDLVLAFRDYEAATHGTRNWGAVGYHIVDPASQMRPDIDALATALGTPRGSPHFKEVDLVLDGGNVVSAATSSGQSYVLVGEDSVVLSAALRNRRGLFAKAEVEKQVAALRAQLGNDSARRSFDKTVAALSAASQYILQSFGDTNRPIEGNRANFLLLSGLSPSEASKLWMATFFPKSLVPIKFHELKSDARKESLALEYMAKLELTREAIRAELGGIPREQIAFVPQVVYHLDLAYHAGEMGEVLGPSADSIEGQDGVGGYNAQRTRDLVTEAGGIIENEALGVRLTPVDGALAFGSTEDKLARNLLNGVGASINDCGDKVFVIASTGDTAGEAKFRETMSGLGVTTYFAPRFLPEYVGNLHCATQETATDASAN